MNKRLRELAAVTLGVLLGLAVIAPIASATKVSEQARACGAEGNQIQAEFELRAGRDIWQRFPALGITPELETDERPAWVVVFRGDFDPAGLQFGAGDPADRLSRVLCVVQSDGTVNLYFDVSRAGSQFVD